MPIIITTFFDITKQSRSGGRRKKNCISPKKIIIDSCYSAIIYFATQILVLDYPILVTTSTITFDILKSRKVKKYQAPISMDVSEKQTPFCFVPLSFRH